MMENYKTSRILMYILIGLIIVRSIHKIYYGINDAIGNTILMYSTFTITVLLIGFTFVLEKKQLDNLTKDGTR